MAAPLSRTLFVLFLHRGGPPAGAPGGLDGASARRLGRPAGKALCRHTTSRRRSPPVVRDRDPTFTRACDAGFRTEAMGVIRTPVRARRANADAERWVRTVRTVRTECLDWLLIRNRSHLERVLHFYIRHSLTNDRTEDLAWPHPRDRAAWPLASSASADVRRHDLLGECCTSPIWPRHEPGFVHPSRGS